MYLILYTFELFNKVLLICLVIIIGVKLLRCILDTLWLSYVVY